MLALGASCQQEPNELWATRLAELRSGSTSYYEADGLGSVSSLSSAAGALVQTYTYDSFGKQTGSSGSVTNWLRYTGREFDTETGISYYRARYYDPTTGRFISEDPIKYRGGIDFYVYVSESPTNLTDPFGLCPPGSPGCPAPNTHNPQSTDACKTYGVDLYHRFFCNLLGGNDQVGKCVRGCLLDQYDTNAHKYKCDESKVHCGCFDACGYTGPAARAARTKFGCDGGLPVPPIVPPYVPL